MSSREPPFFQATVEARNAAESRLNMSAWIEPPSKSMQPSFKEYPYLTIERHGVLQEMAPLGTLPTSKQRKAARQGVLKNAAVAKNDEEASVSTPRDVATPEPTVMRSTRSESRQAEEEEVRPITPATPTTPTTPPAQTSARKSVSRTSAELNSRQVSPSMTPSMSGSPRKVEDMSQRLGQIVDSAVHQALSANRYPTAYALRLLYNEYKLNPRVASLFELNYQGSANEEEQSQFQKLLQYHKNEGRKDDTAIKYFEQHHNTPAAGSLFSASYSVITPSKRSAMDPETPTSSHKNGHISKKVKGNDYKSPFATNGNGALPTTNGMNDSSRSRSRSKSESSSSSLSSLDEELLRENFASPEAASHSQSLAGASNFTTENNHAPTKAHKIDLQPMTRQEALGQQSHAFSDATPTNSTPSSFTPNNTHQNANIKMPVFLEDGHLSSNPSTLQPTSSNRMVNGKFGKKNMGPSLPRRTDEPDRAQSLKRKARKITDYTIPIESFIREPRSPVKADPEKAASIAIAASPSKPGQVLRLRRRKPNEESDDLSSPTLPSFHLDQTLSSAPPSRAGTPSALGRPARKAKNSGPRMKTSPMKNKAGPSAGIPRASGERNSPIANGTNQQDDNDDYCSACGGNGELLCCDGCTRSFHLKCVDPPMEEGSLPDTWLCNVCRSRELTEPPVKKGTGHFADLITSVEKKNPVAFSLPPYIRNAYEGVRTGTEGEFVEGAPASKAKNRAGYDELPDYFKLKDGKGNWVLCHQCNGGSDNKRLIIQCGYCSLSWHLDCLDPPLANPPPLGRSWRCPCHVDDLLSKVPSLLGPAHKFRRLKGAAAIKPAIPRGLKNNGHIDVELTTNDGEEEDASYGQVYKVSEESIKLDFLSRAGKEARPQKSTPMLSPIYPRLDQRSLQDQQAALNLAQIAVIAEIPDGATVLIDALISEAPKDVIEMIARADATDLRSSLFGEELKGLPQQGLSARSKEKAAIMSMMLLLKDRMLRLGNEDEMMVDSADENSKTPAHPSGKNDEDLNKTTVEKEKLKEAKVSGECADVEMEL